MAEIIFAEQTLSFSKNTDDDIYCAQTDAIAMTAGNTYTVVWNGVNYVCVAETTTIEGYEGIAVGNKSIEGLDGNTEEPFYIASSVELGVSLVETLETDETHTVSVYSGVLEEPDTPSEDTDGEVVFAETEIVFSKNTDDDIYCSSQAQERPLIELEADKTYTVVWDGTEYVCAAEAGEISGYVAVFLGNKSIDAELFPDGADTKEPFIIGYASEISTDLIETLETDETHTVAVYMGDITEDDPVEGYLMENQTLAFALVDGSETVYYNDPVVDGGLATAPKITEGSTYTVTWDGINYVCVAKTYTVGSTTFIVLGNLHIAADAEEDTGELFVYLYHSETAANFKTLETDASHVVSIYVGVLAATAADVYTYDQNGAAVLHEGMQTVTLDTPDGRYAVFVFSHISDSRS